MRPAVDRAYRGIDSPPTSCLCPVKQMTKTPSTRGCECEIDVVLADRPGSPAIQRTLLRLTPSPCQCMAKEREGIAYGYDTLLGRGISKIRGSRAAPQPSKICAFVSEHLVGGPRSVRSVAAQLVSRRLSHAEATFHAHRSFVHSVETQRRLGYYLDRIVRRYESPPRG